MIVTIHIAPPFVISVMDVDSVPNHIYTAWDTNAERMHPNLVTLNIIR